MLSKSFMSMFIPPTTATYYSAYKDHNFKIAKMISHADLQNNNKK